jgi:hypothetical protein
MLETTVWPWAALLVLGAFHGINPAMGWLFAVALGLQEGRAGAVWRAIPPLMTGHALAVGAAVAVAVVLGRVVPPIDLRWLVGAALLGTGLFHLVRHRHPRFGGMRVGFRDLAIWSFLMASAHGAGLMAVPFVPGPAASAHGAGVEPVAVAAHSPVAIAASPAPGHAGHHGGGGAVVEGNSPWVAVAATVVHTLGYLVVTGAVAALVYYRLGVALLRRAWFNLDRLWAGALIATSLLVVLT